MRLMYLSFGRRDYDAETARMAAERLRSQGYAVIERHATGGVYVVETNARRDVALDAKRRARVEHEHALAR